MKYFLKNKSFHVFIVTLAILDTFLVLFLMPILFVGFESNRPLITSSHGLIYILCGSTENLTIFIHLCYWLGKQTLLRIIFCVLISLILMSMEFFKMKEDLIQILCLIILSCNFILATWFTITILLLL